MFEGEDPNVITIKHCPHCAVPYRREELTQQHVKLQSNWIGRCYCTFNVCIGRASQEVEARTGQQVLLAKGWPSVGVKDVQTTSAPLDRFDLRIHLKVIPLFHASGPASSTYSLRHVIPSHLCPLFWFGNQQRKRYKPTKKKKHTQTHTASVELVWSNIPRFERHLYLVTSQHILSSTSCHVMRITSCHAHHIITTGTLSYGTSTNINTNHVHRTRNGQKQNTKWTKHPPIHNNRSLFVRFFWQHSSAVRLVGSYRNFNVLTYFCCPRHIPQR